MRRIAMLDSNRSIPIYFLDVHEYEYDALLAADLIYPSGGAPPEHESHAFNNIGVHLLDLALYLHKHTLRP